MMGWIQANRRKMEMDFLGTDRRKYLSPAYYGQYTVMLPALKKFASGNIIDLGCGDMPYRQYIESLVDVYDSLDFAPRSQAVTYQGNIQSMPMIVSERYDCAVCLEVLEHVPNPQQAIHETYRILKKEGIFILSVPHLSRLHEIPYDYYRFTCFGLEHLLVEAGFEIVSIEERGGLLSFLGHQFSLIGLSIVWGIPLLKEIAYFVNSWLVTRSLYHLDRVLKLEKLFPLGYVVVAKKSFHQ